MRPFYRLAGALPLTAFLLLAACGPRPATSNEAVIELKAPDQVVRAGAATKVSLYFRHPSPALPSFGWEADSGSIIRTAVANEILYRAPRTPGTARIRATAVIEQSEYEATLVLRVVDAGSRADSDLSAAEGPQGSSSGFIDKLLFADSGPLYVDPREPSAVDPLILKFRTRAGFGSRVLLHYDRGDGELEREMVRTGADAAFEYHAAELPPREAPVEYWFEIQSGSDRVFYSRSGPLRSVPSRQDRFRLVPGRRVPSWTRGASLYRVDIGAGGVEGLSRKADSLRVAGVDALLLSKGARSERWTADELSGPLARLSDKGIGAMLDTELRPGDTDALLLYAAGLMSAAKGIRGFTAFGASGDPSLSARFRETVKAANPECAVIIGDPAGSALWGDFTLDSSIFSEPVSAFLAGRSMDGNPQPLALGDASAFARSFLSGVSRVSQNMVDTVILALDAPGSAPFMARAALAESEFLKKSGESGQAGAAGRRTYALGLLLQQSLPGSPLALGAAETPPQGPEDRAAQVLRKDLAALRRTHGALRTGCFSIIAAETDGLLAYARWNEKESVIVAMNASRDFMPARLPLGQLGLEEGDRLKTVFSAGPDGHEASGPSYAVRSGAAAVPLGGMSAVVLSGPSPGEAPPKAALRPRVLRSFPADGAREIAQDTRIIVQFSGSMDQRSAEGAFIIAPEAPGTFIWNGNTCAFVPSAPLAPRTRYDVSVTRAMTSRDGGFSMKSGFAFGFTTR
jgi:hypothetical protein